MTKNIYDLANELERSIRQLPEYQAVQKAKTAIDEDDVAKELWSEFVTMQEKMHTLMQTGQMPSQDDQKMMMALSERIEDNAILKQYFDEQQRLSVYVTDLEKIVFAPLQDLVK